MSRNERYRNERANKRASLSRSRSKDSSRRELENAVKRVKRVRKGKDPNLYWINESLVTGKKYPNSWQHPGSKELYSDRRFLSISRRSSSISSSSSSMNRSISRRQSNSLSRSPDLRRSRRSTSERRFPLSRRRSPYRTRRSTLTVYSKRKRKSSSESSIANGSRIRRSRSLSRRRRSPILGQNRWIASPPLNGRGHFGDEKHGRKRIGNSSVEEVRSSTVIICSNSHCKICEGRIPGVRREPPPEPLARPKYPKLSRPIIPIHEHSRSRSFSVPKFTPVVEVSSTTGLPNTGPPPEPLPTKIKRAEKLKSHKKKSHKKKSHKKKSHKKKSHRSKSSHIKAAVLHQSDNKVESMPENSVGCSDMPMSSSGSLTPSERFSKMSQICRAHELPQESLRGTAGDDFRVEIGSPPHPLPTSALGSLPKGISTEDVKGRFAYYKDRGYLGDLTLTDYIKWEEWWYKYQDWLEAQRAHVDRTYRARLYRY